MTNIVLPIKDGCYQTPPNRKVHARFSPRFYFYRTVVKNFAMAAKKSKNGQFDDAAYADVSTRLLYNVEEAGGNIKVENLDVLIPEKWPCVIVGNHMGTLDPILLPSMLLQKGEITFVVKDALMHFPFFKHILSVKKPIVVGRTNPREDLAVVLREGEQAIKEGKTVIIFPQHTRRPTFISEEFNKIGLKLAKRAGVPIAPLALKTDFFAQGKMLKEFGPIFPERTVHFSYGEPMEVEGNGIKQHQACIDFIQSQFNEWNKE